MPLRQVRPNIVQSIRAHRVEDLQAAAEQLGHHFLYANLAQAQSKQDVLDLIASQYTFPAHFGKNFDALYDCLTDTVHKSGPQTGFIVVLEHIPAHAKFDKEAASSCWISSAMPPTTGPTAKLPSAASIHSRWRAPPRATKQPKRPIPKPCPPTSCWMSAPWLCA